MQRSGSWYIPTLYFIEGLPYTMVNMMSVVFLKNLNFDNSAIGLYTSLLYIPWIAKFLWAPMVDLFFTRRFWILLTHVVLAVLTIILSLVVLKSGGIMAYCGLFLLIALASATQDIAIDGYYMDVLTGSQQAFYVGIRNTAYKVAWLFGSGGMVYLVGMIIDKIADHTKGTIEGWSVAFAVCAIIFILATFWHAFILPKQERKAAVQTENSFSQFFAVFSSFLKQPGIGIIILYILIFRLGDALMLKMAQPFLLDPHTKGGLELSTAQVGLIYGTVGVMALLLGGIVGGWLVSKYDLKRCLLPTAIIQNSAILLYWLLAILKPGFFAVGFVNALEQFSYGLGTAAYITFLLTIVKEEYKAAHYAIATALMALGLVLPGSVSGYLADYLGYQNFFLLSFLLSLPGIICIFYLPIKSLKQATK